MPGGGGGDPRFENLVTSTIFYFDGVPERTYRILAQGPFVMDGRFSAKPHHPNTPEHGRTILTRLRIYTTGPSVVTIGVDGRVHVADPEHDVWVHVLGCSLPSHDPKTVDPLDHMNHANYINYILSRHPEIGPDDRGIIVDGDREDVRFDDYESPDPIADPD